jgi:hypothetical protein
MRPASSPLPLLFVSCAALSLAACPSASSTPSAAGSGDPASSGVGAETAAAAAPVAPAGPRAEGTGAGATEGSARWLAEEDAADPLPDLVGLMRRAGFAEAGRADLAAFVPVPPGATGVAGTFSSPDGEVRVAVVAYPNEQYARPHQTDIEERRRVVADTAEAVARRGAVVLHVRAGDRAAADELAARLAREMGWDSPAR